MRSTLARIAAATGAAVTAGACAVSMALPAQAAPAAPTDNRPSCVNVRHTVGNVTQTVYVDNHCKKPVSYIVKTFGVDSACQTTKPNQTGAFKWPRPRPYEGITWNCA